MKALRQHAREVERLSQRRGGGERAEEALEHEVDAGLQSILDSVIGEEYLQSVTGKSDLSVVTYLQLKVDLNVQSLLDINELLPALKSLVLDDSIMSSIRDLGIGLRCLISLSLNSCSLNDLDGVGVLTGLQDFSACDNFITDVAPLAMHESLATLNLSGNNLSDISIADALSTCPKLSALFLGRNPIEKMPNYRLVIASLIPSLEKLDGCPVDAAAQRKVSNGMVLEAAMAMHLADEALDDERRMEGDMVEPPEHGHGQGQGQNHNTYRGTIPDTGSELTHGSAVVLAGNVAAAMRKRRSSKQPAAGGGPSSSSGSSSSGGSGSGSGGGGTVSSTLEILDFALKGRVSGASDGMSSPYLGEGDVTASVMGSMYPTSQALSLSMSLIESGGPRMDPSVSPSIIGASAARPKWRSENEASYSFDAEEVGGYLQSVNAWGSRPRSAVPSSMRGSWMAGEGGTIHEGEGDDDPAHSPRQRNGSRPQSAAGDGRSRATPSAPFKVAVDAADLRQFRERIHVSARQGPTDKATTVFHDGNKPKAVNKKGSKRVDDDDEDDGGDLVDDANARTEQDGHHARFGTKSYIHKDIVVRGAYDESDEGGDGEGIAVTHSARTRLMSASGRRPAAQDAPLLPAPSASPASSSAPPARPAQPSAPAAASRTVASIAGISLGFDLKGSLAAIDQWVEDMDSDDDSDEPGLLEAERGVDRDRPGASDVESARCNSSRTGSAGSNRSREQRVLSRDRIFSMVRAQTLTFHLIIAIASHTFSMQFFLPPPPPPPLSLSRPFFPSVFWSGAPQRRRERQCAARDPRARRRARRGLETGADSARPLRQALGGQQEEKGRSSDPYRRAGHFQGPSLPRR